MIKITSNGGTILGGQRVFSGETYVLSFSEHAEGGGE